jgi:alpha-galactosidase
MNLLVQNGPNEYSEALWNGTHYRTKEDVFIKFNQNDAGKLTLDSNSGFAATCNNKGGCFGPEVGFGWTLSERLPSEPIFLIKTAYGGRDLAVAFRPPSAGQGNYPNVDPDGQYGYGWQYRIMMADIRDILDNIADYVPGYDESEGYVLSGFVWFQGWNDLIDYQKVLEYGSNLAHFIRDVRLELSEPALPFGAYLCLKYSSMRQKAAAHTFPFGTSFAYSDWGTRHAWFRLRQTNFGGSANRSHARGTKGRDGTTRV